MAAAQDTEKSELGNALSVVNAAAEHAGVLLAALGDGLSIQDKNFTILYQNGVHIEMTGQHCGKQCYRAYEARDAICPGCPVARTFADGKIHTAEREVPMGGILRYFEITASPLKDNAGNIIAGIEIVREITARKEGEINLRQQETRYRQLFSHMKSGVIVCRAGLGMDEFILVDINEAAERYERVKKQDVLGRRLPEIFPSMVASGLFTIIHRVWQTGTPHHHENVFYTEDHRTSWKQYYIYKLDTDEIVAIFDDLSKEKEVEEDKKKMAGQIQHVQRLESLGVLAGGIAHDFNNLLMAIMGNADLALFELPESSPQRICIQTIMKAALRAADLCKQMLIYAGKGQFKPITIDINDLIKDMAHLLQISVAKKTRLTFRLAKEVPAIQADENQLRQVFINLVINASEAIGNRDGDITIATGTAECDRDFLDRNGLPDYLSTGLYTFVTISDTGCGMDAQTKAKLFDPFFTTKFPGRGLGMSAVMGIVKGHWGFIIINSEPGEGTTVKVFFPALLAGKNRHLDISQVMGDN